MFRITTLTVCTGGVALLIAACGGATGPQEPGDTGTMEATIDGTLWRAEHVFADYDTLSQELWVSGSRENSGGKSVRHIQLQQLTITGPGTFSLTLDGPRALLFDGDISVIKSYGTTDMLTGTATVTDFDLAARRCSGTFSFVAATNFVRDGPLMIDTIHVTNGSWTAVLHVH